MSKVSHCFKVVCCAQFGASHLCLCLLELAFGGKYDWNFRSLHDKEVGMCVCVCVCMCECKNQRQISVFYLTVEAVSAALPGKGLQQAPDDILTTAPLLRSTIPGSTSRVIRVATAMFWLTKSNRPCSGISMRLCGAARDSSRQFTRKPISFPLMASLMGLLALWSIEKSARTTMVSTPWLWERDAAVSLTEVWSLVTKMILIPCLASSSA